MNIQKKPLPRDPVSLQIPNEYVAEFGNVANRSASDIYDF